MPDNVKEKLVELLNKVQDTGVVEIQAGFGITHGWVKNELVASHLIANCVTVQGDKDINVPSKWILVKDRLPTIYDADADNCVLAIHKASNKRYYHWRSVADNPFDFTHWMKTPQPPKGE